MNVIDLDTHAWDERPFSVPAAVRAVSLAHQLVPDELADRELDPTTGVSSYLLLGQRGSVTDFHQDFSGTSVFYLVLRGQKEFFVVRPSDHNIAVFQQWSQWTSENFRATQR